MNNPKLKIQRLTKISKIEVKKKVKSKSINMIQLSNKSNYPNNNESKFTHVFNETLKLNKNEYCIGLKYIIHPSLVTKPNYIFIHLDLIDNTINNNNVLKILKPNESNEYIFNSPHYFSINKSVINKITVYFLDENNEEIIFEKGLVLLELEIIKK
jgi:hypothetical protein